MNLLLDAKDYVKNHLLLGTILFAIVALVVLFITVLSFLFLSRGGTGAPSPFLICGSMLLFFLFPALYLKINGMILSSPIKVYEEGLELQSMFALTSDFVNFSDIRYVCLERVWNGQSMLGQLAMGSGCTIKTGTRTYSSKELFSKEALQKFAEQLTPILKKKSLVLKSKIDEKLNARFVFERI